jgi:putative flavoprotein involved in K+ transport
MSTTATPHSVPTQAPAPARVERFDAVVIGAGQAGLATGHHLARQDVDFVIVDGDARVGDGWRRRWDSLRLFTPAAYSGLPGMPFPAPPAHLPDKDEVADYLERYAERFDLPVRSDARVEWVRRDGDLFVVQAGGSRLEARSVVVATGPYQRPSIPSIAAQLDPAIVQLHSSAYRNPFALPEGPVLVVGVGNSGAQIAMEVARHRPTWLAGREKGHLPRRILGRDVYDWLWPVISRVGIDTRLGRRLRERTRGGDPLVGIMARDIAATGVRRVGRLAEARDGLPVLDGEVLHPATIIWCTGFAPDYRWIGLPATDAAGHPRHERGVANDVEGLFWVGLRWQHRMTSALLGGVGEDARFIAGRVAERCAAVDAG